MIQKDYTSKEPVRNNLIRSTVYPRIGVPCAQKQNQKSSLFGQVLTCPHFLMTPIVIIYWLMESWRPSC